MISLQEGISAMKPLALYGHTHFLTLLQGENTGFQTEIPLAFYHQN
jgi:hypothetical protein